MNERERYIEIKKTLIIVTNILSNGSYWYWNAKHFIQNKLLIIIILPLRLIIMIITLHIILIIIIHGRSTIIIILPVRLIITIILHTRLIIIKIIFHIRLKIKWIT